MFTRENIDGLLSAGGNVLAVDGDKVGSIGQVYVDDDNGQPTWVTVKTGLFGTSESFVPLEGARTVGNDIRVAYTKDEVKGAPRVDVDGHLEPSEEDRLYEHYGLAGRTYSDMAGTGTDFGYAGTDRTGEAGYTDAGRTEQAGYPGTDRTRGTRYAGTAGTAGRESSGPAADDAMTRSEERLNVGSERQEAGRVRLRKYVATENVTQTVPVQREEVRLEREPITEANRGAAMSGPDLKEDEHEVILHEERPVVEKETVPVERVRLGTETVADEATVNEEVRKEKIDTEASDDTRR
jgi:uncharacterized protein (TIGR02271 family)